MGGHDGWRASSPGRGWSGTVDDSIAGLGRSAFIGYGRPLTPLTRVSHSLSVPTSSALSSVLRFECLLGLSSSVSGSDDAFALQFFNASGVRLAGIQFDTASASFGIWIDNGVTQVEATALLVTDAIQVLSIDIDFAANRWWAFLDGTTVFENQVFTGTTAGRNPGAFSFDWQVASFLNPGDNWLLIDDLSISAPELKLLAQRTDQGSLLLSWVATRAASYQVQVSEDAIHWVDLPGALLKATTPRADLRFEDVEVSLRPHRFYRAIQIDTKP